MNLRSQYFGAKKGDFRRSAEDWHPCTMDFYHVTLTSRLTVMAFPILRLDFFTEDAIPAFYLTQTCHDHFRGGYTLQ